MEEWLDYCTEYFKLWILIQLITVFFRRVSVVSCLSYVPGVSRVDAKQLRVEYVRAQMAVTSQSTEFHISQCALVATEIGFGIVTQHRG